jgi:ribosomal-protein-alanine N-acetyltransferase
MNPETLPTFMTSRLILRGVSLEDLPSYEKHFIDYEVIRHLSAQVPWPYPKGGVKTFLETFILPKQGKTRWSWAITRKEEPGEMIGMIDLWREGCPENRGFWLGRKFWGKGFMTEATSPVLQYAFTELGFESLIFSNAEGNLRSRRIKEKTGARFIGLREAKFVDPQYTKAETWEMSREEWMKQNPSD